MDQLVIPEYVYHFCMIVCSQVLLMMANEWYLIETLEGGVHTASESGLTCKVCDCETS